LREIYNLNKGENRNDRHLISKSEEVRALVAEHPDATLVELCELFAQKTGNWVSRAAMCRYLQKLELNRKKKHGTVAKLRQKKSKN
jgi:transposase